MALTLNDALCARCGETRQQGSHGPAGHRFERYAVIIDDPLPARDIERTPEMQTKLTEWWKRARHR